MPFTKEWFHAGHYVVDQETGCWLWTGNVTSNGYGRLGRGRRAHVIAWLVFKEQPIGRLCVCHKCDVRLCVNPDHLFLGTNSDNQVDSVRKGRHAVALLSVKDVEDIRKRSAPSHVVAQDYGVCSSTIRKIRNGYNWKHV